MKILVLLFFITISLLKYSNVKSQVKVHKDLRTSTWNIIGLRYDKELSPGKWGSVYPPSLKALNNKIIELPGYMIPTKVGRKFTEFMFSIVPVESCPYCGTGDIPAMLQVSTNVAIPITDKPIKLKGKFVINDSGNDQSEFFLLNAVLVLK
ncbi:hypothetical protein QWY86_03535 [Pedobacter aquatilis]|uniref:hypothetical protein n=1 Tax=Pedobacter aquatilis TaxID=351343 RepID=UPI0025B2D37D|nr:hypothetical protein [Pedobacter aquatilis]MDN3585723.1 hypothetical protein [Pedobacter aquatilis]